MPNSLSILEQYDFEYPDGAIAQAPAHPRDSARLLVYDRKRDNVEIDTFRNITKYLPKNAVLVLNETKVVPARLVVQKVTGGRVKLLYLHHNAKSMQVLADKKVKAGDVLSLTAKLKFTVLGEADAGYAIKPNFPITQVTSVLQKYGHTPLPPYIKHTPLTERKLREEYQTVFAKKTGSVAAPTASLHFTKRLLAQIKKSGCKIEFVTLHVGLGTFASLTASQLKSGKLHSEWYEVSHIVAKRLERYRAEGRPIFAVGTTALRTLEASSSGNGKIIKPHGETDLFIRPPYKFKFVDGLITNFHVPKSSLLMLVSALVGRKKLLSLYKLAIGRGFRLFSFGDGMIIK